MRVHLPRQNISACCIAVIYIYTTLLIGVRTAAPLMKAKFLKLIVGD